MNSKKNKQNEKTTKKDIQSAIKLALKKGNWIIRADNDGVSANENASGFKWAPLGEWTEAPDWDDSPECGHGLHGQDKTHGGTIFGTRLVFCDTDGQHVPIDRDKVKVRRARILMINELPAGLRVSGALDLSHTKVSELPTGLRVGGYLDLSYTKVKELPPGLRVGGGLYLIGTKVSELPPGLRVGGGLDLYGTKVSELPPDLEVKGEIYR